MQYESYWNVPNELENSNDDANICLVNMEQVDWILNMNYVTSKTPLKPLIHLSTSQVWREVSLKNSIKAAEAIEKADCVFSALDAVGWTWNDRGQGEVWDGSAKMKSQVVLGICEDGYTWLDGLSWIGRREGWCSLMLTLELLLAVNPLGMKWHKSCGSKR